jgi:hypothetical protein
MLSGAVMEPNQMWEEALHRQRVDEWLTRCYEVDHHLKQADKALTPRYRSLGNLRFERAERICGQFNASLVEPGHLRTPNGTSIPRSEGHDVLKVIDNGTVMVTDEWIRFTGSRYSKELLWRAVADEPEVRPGSVTVLPTGTQPPVVIAFHPAHTAKITFEIALALRLFDGAGEALLLEYGSQLDDLVTHPPKVPDGADADDWALRLTNLASVRLLPKPKAPWRNPSRSTPDQSTELTLPLGCFCHTPAEQVAGAAVAAGFTTRLLSPHHGEALLEPAGPAVRTVTEMADAIAHGVEVTVIAGDAEYVVSTIGSRRPERSLVVATVAPEGVPVLDMPRSPDVVRLASQWEAEVIAAERHQAGSTVHQLDCSDLNDPDVLAALVCKARVLRHVGRAAQVLIVTGPIDVWPDLEVLGGFDEVIVVANPDQDNAHEIASQESGGDDTSTGQQRRLARRSPPRPQRLQHPADDAPDAWTEIAAYLFHSIYPGHATLRSDGTATWTPTRFRIFIVRSPRIHEHDPLVVARPDWERIFDVVRTLEQWDEVTLRLWQAPDVDVLVLLDIAWKPKSQNWDVSS